MAKAEAAGADAGISSKSGPIGAAWAWLMLAVGIAAGAGWVPAAQKLSERISVTAPGPAVGLFDLLVFGPLIAIAVVLGLLSRRPVLRMGERPVLWTLAGLGCGAIAIGSTTGFAWLNGSLRPALQPSPMVPALVALGIALTVLQAGAEEVLFRGWLQPALIERIGVAPGVLAGALVFVGFHAIGAVPSILALVNLLLGGLWFGLLALRSGGILAPLAAHFAYNVIEDCGLGLVPNPGVGQLGALHDFDLIGSPLWGSTAEGLNASIGTTAALLAMLLPLLVRPAPRLAPSPALGRPLPSHRPV